MGGTAIGRASASFNPRSGPGLRGPRASPAAFGVTLLLHAAVLAALLAFEPTRAALMAAAPIMVELIVPPEVKPPPPPKLEKPPELPRPKPIAKAPPKQVEPLPILTVPAEAPTPIVVAPQTPPVPAPADAVVVPERVALPVTQPIYNADYLDNPSPAYPVISRRNGEQGRVVLRVRVNPEGRAAEVEIRGSSGFSRLDEAARDTVARWKFVPAKRGVQAIAAWVLIPISFKLEG